MGDHFGHWRFRSGGTLLTCLLAVSAPVRAVELPRLGPAEWAQFKSREAARCQRIASELEASRLSLGLGLLDGFQEAGRFTDGHGRTHARFHQTYRGVEVWNGNLVGHVDRDGHSLPLNATLQAGINLDPSGLLGKDAIRTFALANLPDRTQRILTMSIRPLVFPTACMDGLKLVAGPDGVLGIDPVYSVATPRKKDPFVWAFQVNITQAGTHGLTCFNQILDGRTGEELRKWDGLSRATASVGQGVSQYSGTVTLDTSLLTDGSGTYTLVDTTRPTRPWPVTPLDDYGNPTVWPEFEGVGNRVVRWDAMHAYTNPSNTFPYVQGTDSWGDGVPFVWGVDDPSSQRGQTAAVDAFNNLNVTWDYYKAVHGRNGIDDLGSSALAIVHMDDGMGGPLNNAFWSNDSFTMSYGDGGENGSLTSLDVAAHEMSHGVMAFTANLDGYGGESGGANESNSDIHSVMARYWLWGDGGRGSKVPDTVSAMPEGYASPLDMWTMGIQLSATGTPTRWLYKPSLDGVSSDAWFDGVGLEDVHFSMGPVSRAFYFLSQGAAADPASDLHSAYLPQGMAGVGNDKAIRIWYNGMATKITDMESNLAAIRTAMVASAAELFPGDGASDSAEVTAVKAAFTAVNVVDPEDPGIGVRVQFPENPDSPFTYRQIIVVPSRVPVILPPPIVRNASDTSVTWSLGGLPGARIGGRLDQGWFTAPDHSQGGSYAIKATSAADPRQFAVTDVWGGCMDCDSDTELDACDLAAIALTYGDYTKGGQFNIYPAARLYKAPFGVDDVCVELFLEGFNNAFNH